ncbi:hypothetical protein HOD75_03515 [archaeon]|jgi:hypothetical protein|nr:hypothetical protein [archaeon]MBT4241942.1 hypothetical protein [archaeon]MBT4418489.1 hypothetical protein [archaeon]
MLNQTPAQPLEQRIRLAPDNHPRRGMVLQPDPTYCGFCGEEVDPKTAYRTKLATYCSFEHFNLFTED